MTRSAADGKYTPAGRTFARVRITDDEAKLWEILPGELDELESQGWVSLLPPGDDDAADAAKVRVTDGGEWALRCWLKKNGRRLLELIRTHFTREAK